MMGEAREKPTFAGKMIEKGGWKCKKKTGGMRFQERSIRKAAESEQRSALRAQRGKKK